MFSKFKKNKADDFKELTFLGDTSNSNERKKIEKMAKILESLNEGNARNLNELGEWLLGQMGFQSQIIDGKNDQGVDIIGFKDNKKVIAVQCKAKNIRGNTERVSKANVASFRGDFLSNGFEKGIYLTNHYYTEQAYELADDNLILLDRRQIIRLINRFYPNLISDFYYYRTLDDVLPDCKKCNEGKILRLWSSQKGKKGFYYYFCETCNERKGNEDYALWWDKEKNGKK